MASPRKARYRKTRKLSAKYVHSILKYEPQSGCLFWKISKAQRIKKNIIAGTKSPAGYILITIDDAAYMAHRLAFLLQTGHWPDKELDHINLNKSDNRWINLREATRSQNKGNTRLLTTNKSGFKGVHKYRKKWVASIKIDQKTKHIGVFFTAKKAHAAYCIAANKYFGIFSRAK